MGVKSVYRILQARKYAKLTFDDLKRLRVTLKRAVYFITCGGKFIGTDDTVKVKTMLIAAENRNNPQQLSMFGGDAAISALNGEL